MYRHVTDVNRVTHVIRGFRMTAVVVALLGCVVLATAVLAVVGAAHEASNSPRMRRRLNRWRVRRQYRAALFEQRMVHVMLRSRRVAANLLTRTDRPRVYRPPTPARLGHSLRP